MNIPDDVLRRAKECGQADGSDYRFIADWMRVIIEIEVSELLALPEIYSTAAVTGVIRSLAAIRSFGREV